MRSLTGATEFRGALDSLASGAGPGAFLLSPGDIDPPADVKTAIDEKLGSGFPWFPVIGNHEAETPSDMAYLRAYDPSSQYGGKSDYSTGPAAAPTTCFSFDAGTAHFVVINEYYDGESDIGSSPPPSDAKAGTISQALYDWLKADLTQAQARHPAYIFVIGHEPLYSLPDEWNGRLRHAGECLDAHPDEVRAFVELMRSYAVTAYICGHTHDCSYALVDGIPQIDAGHARGNADSGAPSSFLRVNLYANFAELELWRDLSLSGLGGAYAKRTSFRLAPEP